MTTPRIVLCKASAGSGKTFTLAKTFLRIVLERPKEYDRILAVTFTNKATEEMKSRILRFLTEISRLQTEEDVRKSAITQSLLADMPGWDHQRLKGAAKDALSYILHDYSHFSIMTIDSFFQRLVRSFIHELKLSYVAGVSMDTDAALDRAVSALIDSYNQDDENPLNKWLKEISLHRMDEGNRWHPADTIKQLSKELFKEKLMEMEADYPVEVVAPLYRELRAMVFAFRSEITSRAQNIMDAIYRNGLDGKFSSNHFQTQTNKFIDDPEQMHYKAKVLAAINGESLPFSKDKLKGAQGAQLQGAWTDEIQPLALELLEYHEHNIRPFNTAKAILVHLQGLALLSAVKDKMREYREQEQVMLISDNTQLINRIVSNTDAPFLYEKLGNRYRYILLDEFQDTSSLQWQNLLPLLLESLAHRDHCKVLIVGDAKQSIYRWRNGNLRLIIQQVREDMGHLWQEESEMVLKTNYRSREKVVEFNNHLFGPLSEISGAYLLEKHGIDPENTPLHDLLDSLYHHEDARQDVHLLGGGYVSVQFFTSEDNKKPNALSTPANSDEDESLPDEDSPRMIHLRSLLNELKEGKGFAEGDICILVRQNSKGAELAEMLERWGFNVNSAEALLFEKSPVIRLLLDTLRYLSKPDEDLYAVALAFAQARLTGNDATPLLNVANARKYVEGQLPPLGSREEILRMKGQPLPDLVLELMEVMKLHALRNIYTEQFLDQVRAFASGITHTTLEDFLEWWGLKDRSIQSSGNLDAIQIMTIHKSKGLEFPVVIVPFADWKLVETAPNKAPIIWPSAPDIPPFNTFTTYPIRFPDARESFFEDAYREEAMLQAADNLNMAYVAFTRAAEHLYIMATVPKKPEERTKEPGTIGKLLYVALEQTDPNGWEDMHYSSGIPHHKSEYTKEEKSRNEPQLLQPRGVSYQHALGLRVRDTYSDERIMGQAVHDMAARYRKGADIDLLAKSMALRHALTDAQYKELLLRMNNFFNNPEIMAIYHSEWHLVAERDFYHQGERLRFDLLLTDGKRAHLFDLKTGGEEEQNVEQLKRYKEGLQATGLNIEKAALIYIDPVGNPYFKHL